MTKKDFIILAESLNHMKKELNTGNQIEVFNIFITNLCHICEKSNKRFNKKLFMDVIYK